MNKVSMQAQFKILKKIGDAFVPINKDIVKCLSIGGFSFDINGESIPFDWDAASGCEENGVFSFETGSGFFWNDYEVKVAFDDEDWENVSVRPEDITAEFLASVSKIYEFFIDFDDGDTEVGIGSACEKKSARNCLAPLNQLLRRKLLALASRCPLTSLSEF